MQGELRQRQRRERIGHIKVVEDRPIGGAEDGRWRPCKPVMTGK